MDEEPWSEVEDAHLDPFFDERTLLQREGTQDDPDDEDPEGRLIEHMAEQSSETSEPAGHAQATNKPDAGVIGVDSLTNVLADYRAISNQHDGVRSLGGDMLASMAGAMLDLHERLDQLATRLDRIESRTAQSPTAEIERVTHDLHTSLEALSTDVGRVAQDLAVLTSQSENLVTTSTKTVAAQLTNLHKTIMPRLDALDARVSDLYRMVATQATAQPPVIVPTPPVGQGALLGDSKSKAVRQRINLGVADHVRTIAAVVVVVVLVVAIVVSLGGH